MMDPQTGGPHLYDCQPFPMLLSVKKILEHSPIKTSAPCRIDAGGTWDIKAMALPMQKLRPVTVNAALNLRVRLAITSYREGWVKISSQGFSRDEMYRISELPFSSPFGLYFAAISYFGFHGLQVKIESAAPPKAGLGGSSAALVSLISALSKLRAASGTGKRFTPKQILHLGYHLEDGISLGNCGMQDQAAATFGGVNLWIWHYGNPGSPYTKETLLDIRGQKEMSKHFLLAYTGKSHVSLRTNRSWVTDFLSGRTRRGWLEANELVTGFAHAVHEKNWKQAADLLKAEMAVRRKITPDALSPIADRLIGLAEHIGCGARFSGAGAGGCVWAIGPEGRIKNLRIVWDDLLKSVPGASILDSEIEPRGLE
ncbi:MAG: galactokinase [Deltaproteobacteria bacterium]|nr:galactokinase [Deltaproteobacteria bacterium]